MNLSLVSAKGGVGTTTLAVMLARMVNGSAVAPLTTDQEDLCAVAGLPAYGDGPVTFGDGPTIFDLGTTDEIPAMRDGLVLAVLRGPDYVGLRHLLAMSGDLQFDGVLVVWEAGRALGVSDVEAVLNLSVVATIPANPAIARSVDAGLLAARIPQEARKALEALAARLVAP